MSHGNSGGTRRVEFSGLSTINSEAAEESPAPHWDSETDHLLSYFLEDPHNGHASNVFQDFTSSAPHHQSPSNGGGGAGEMNPPLGMNASYGPSSSRTSSNSTLTENVEPPQPRTPAMQFYHPGKSKSSSSSSSSHHHQSHHHSQQHQQQLTTTSYARQTAENIAGMQQQQQHRQGPMIKSSSSSSSISSMAANLVSGGSVLHHQIQHQHQHHASHKSSIANSMKPSSASSNSNNIMSTNNSKGNSPPGHGDDSPISPAAMIGLGNEELMLPPPSRKNSSFSPQGPPPSGASSNNNNDGFPPHQQQIQPVVVDSNMQQQQQHPQQKQQQHQNEGHLQWLQQLNARAKAAIVHNPNQQQHVPPGVVMGHPGLHPHSHAPVPPQHHPSAAGVVTMAGVPGAPASIYHAGTFPSAEAAAAAVAQNPMLYQAAMNHKFHMAAQSQGETEEKRARRLERNRESARKSRRRKKERLSTVEGQVDRLHTKIEDERKMQVNAMCGTLKQVRRDEMAKVQNEFEANPGQGASAEGQQRVATVIQSTSGGSHIAQATVEFQYTILRQVLLPRYQKFLLWLTLHNEGFFGAGKEEYTRKDGKQVLRVSSGRVSSKQIGDELTNGWKTEKPTGKKKTEAETPDIGERMNPTSRSLDAPRMWPLLCFELSISVDQEERILQALKRLQQMENLANYRSQLAAATKLTSSLTTAISAQQHIASARENKSILGVLTPEQSAKFHAWMSTNQERCSRVIQQRQPKAEKTYPVLKETALIEFCRRLDEVLRISSKIE